MALLDHGGRVIHGHGGGIVLMGLDVLPGPQRWNPTKRWNINTRGTISGDNHQSLVYLLVTCFHKLVKLVATQIVCVVNDIDG